MTSVIRTPFTDMFSAYGIHLQSRRCRDFEMNMVECLEAYGYRKGSQICKDEIDDYFECTHATKQMKRVREMKAERKRQWWQGKRSFRNYYSDPPTIDSYDDLYR